jgi:DNA-directed RNA polymerase subunit beta'
MKTTIGQIMINEALPAELRDYSRVLDKKGVKELFTRLAEKHPDQYTEVAKNLMDIGRDFATQTNGYSFGLDALEKTAAATKAEYELEQKLAKIYTDRRIPEKQRYAKALELMQEKLAKLPAEVMDEALKTGNPIARQVLSGAKGNRMNLNALIGADLIYSDSEDKPVPFPILRNYSQGFRPYEYFAGSYGARKGVLDTKLATMDAGYLLKQLTQMNHRLLVTAQDDDTPYDSDNPRGYPVDTDDADNAGALLAHPVGDYARNTVLTPKILKSLKASGFNKILVRSPIVGGPEDGGVFGRDVGLRERGQIAPVGDFVGIAAAQALGERLTQGALSSKHSGGAATATSKAISGFSRVNSLIQVPKNFPDEATHATVDGKVDRLEPAPQGGQYLYIGSERHYVLPNHNLLVKPGDVVDAGDALTDGMPNPAMIVKHKGVGEGRRYFTDIFRQTMVDSGIPANRRNVELLSRGLINYVRLQDPYQDWVPDDIVPYHVIERRYKPRPGYQTLTPTAATGKYLERPVLHYSIGTKLQPKMVKQLQDFGVKQVFAHNDRPIFEPEMIRGATNVTNDPDWMTRMLGAYQEKSLLRGVHRGDVSDISGSSYVPALAKGLTFGEEGATKAWKPAPDMTNPAK